MSLALPCQPVGFDMRSKATKNSADSLVDGSTKSLLIGEFGLHPRDPLLVSAFRYDPYQGLWAARPTNPILYQHIKQLRQFS